MTTLTLVPREQILVDPVGRAAVIGQSSMMWCVDPGLTGISFWGRPTHADLADLLSQLTLPHHPRLRVPCDTVLDGRRLEGLEPQAFEVLVEHALRRRDAILQRMRRQALVRPVGLPGAVFSGFNALLELGYEWRVFSSLREALVWLDREDGPELGAEVDRLAEVAAGTPELLRRLRVAVAGDLRNGRLSTIAGALGVSTRSLQRALADGGSTFRGELSRARVDRASQLLVETDDKLDAIARRVGFASLSQLSTAFRRTTGETPSEFRGRRRGAAS